MPADEDTLSYVDDGEPSSQVGAKIGRYQLLELVGTGGMGMVWGAWDPELERRVALKLVRLVGVGARERMLREGQVLARLSHPNVVPIYDVGVMGEQVYLVMEWVRGTTLRGFAEEKPTERDLVDAFRQAGAGLAAVHEAGVIHRDFKPTNAVRGDDGRVRVLDFGIASGEATAARVGGGTPRYMAPELRAGEVATVASDQYAFCISLLEAFGADATPSWVAAIVERGTDPDPAKRFPSMAALLDELAHDPARRRRRVAVGFALVIAALGAFAIGRSGSRDATGVEPCSGAATEIAASWNPALRERVVAHLRSLGPLAEADRIVTALDGYSTAWVAAHDHACKDFERKALTPSLYQTRLTCLARTRSQLAAVGELMSAVHAGELPQALRAARSLPDVAGCAEITSAVVPPPAAVAERVQEIVPQIERALVLAIAQRAEAAELAHAATARARETAYEPLVARALLVEGRAEAVDTRHDARGVFAEAMRRALRVSDDVLAVEAYARWVFELARKGETTIDSWDVMTEVAARLERDGRFARALMYNNRAVAFLAANDQASARAMLEQARTAAGGLEHLELLVIEANIVFLERDPVAYEAGVRRIYERRAAALGPAHPDTLVQRIPLALLEHDGTKARAAMLDTSAGYMRWQQYEPGRLCTFEAAMLAIDAGDRAAAAMLMGDVIAQSRALAMRDAVVAWIEGTVAEPVDIRASIAEAYIVQDTASVATLERLLAAQNDTPWQRLETVDGLIVLERWARADEVLRTIGHPMYQRREAQVRRGLARELARSDLTRARALAREARDYYEQDPSAAAARAELDAILTEAR